MTVIYGGSFDPVHNGHLNAVRAVIKQIHPERTIIMPAFVSPFKIRTGATASSDDRIEMCRLAFESEGAEISDHEISEQGISYTIDTLEYLSRLYKGERFALMLGSDSLRSLPMWRRSKDIMQIADILAVSRTVGEDLTEDAQRIRDVGGRVTVVTTEPFEISSTQLRAMLAAGEDVSALMPDSVYRYIREKQLYSTDGSMK